MLRAAFRPGLRPRGPHPPAGSSVRPAWPGVELCHNATFGLVLVNVDSDIERAMVLRIGGPHPQITLFERAGRRLWLAPFRLCQPGSYTALVRLITVDPFAGFELNASQMTSLPRSSLHGMHRPITLGLGFAQRCTCHQNRSGLVLPRFEFWVEHGEVGCSSCLWTWQEGALTPVGIEARDRLSDFAETPHAYHKSRKLPLEPGRGAGMAAHFRELSYRSNRQDILQGASLAWWRQESSEAKGFPLCLLGDSHLRNLANSLVALRDSSCDAEGRQQNKTLCRSVKGRKTLVHFMLTRTENSGAGRIKFYAGSKLRNNYRHELEHCGAIVMSYGQWGLSYQQLSIGPMTLSMFEKEVRRAISWLWGFCKKVHLPCAWMGISPSPLVMKGGRRKTQGASLMTTQIQCPPREWRLPHLIRRLNLAAHAAAEFRGLDYIDIWPIALPLLDTSFDGNHYQAPVGPAVANATINWLWSRLQRELSTSTT